MCTGLFAKAHAAFGQGREFAGVGRGRGNFPSLLMAIFNIYVIDIFSHTDIYHVGGPLIFYFTLVLILLVSPFLRYITLISRTGARK